MGKPKGSTGNVVLTDVRAKTALQQKSPGVQKKTSTVEDGAAKKGKSFIDDLFATSKKECQSKTTKPGKQETGSPDEAPARRKEVRGKKDDLFGLVDEARKKTEEGWNVYTEAELKLNKKGGDTDLCPFDCECCF